MQGSEFRTLSFRSVEIVGKKSTFREQRSESPTLAFHSAEIETVLMTIVLFYSFGLLLLVFDSAY